MIAILIAFTVNLAAQEEMTEKEVNLKIEKTMQDVEEGMIEVEVEMSDLDKKTITINPVYKLNGPKMGVYLSDLDFKDIYELHYDYNYGVLVTGVTEDGPSQKAGIMDGDIIMEFGGIKVRFEDHLVRLIRSHNIGDEVIVKFFRDENIYETTLLLDTLKKEGEVSDITIMGKKKKAYSAGFGGGSWYPIWFTPDVTEINDFLAELGFKEETFSENGFLIHGGGGMGNVGKNWFLGGMGAGYGNSETTKHTWVHYKNGELDSTRVSRKAEYSAGFGGVTLDKRFAFSRSLIASLGFMIGWGGTTFEVTQTDDNGDVPNFDFDGDLNAQMDDYYDYKSKLKIKQDYILFHPKATFLYRILEWLAFRAEVGYMVSYSSAGWKASRNGESIKLLNEPDYDMNGLTISVGPWFGF